MFKLHSSLARRHGDDAMDMMSGTPWLEGPVTLTSSRESSCELTSEQCAYQSYWWRNWYVADLAFGLSPIYFFAAVVGLFTALRIISRLRPRSVANSRFWQKAVALSRYAAYKSFALRPLMWYSPSLGVIGLGLLGVVFFLGITFGPHPYYWPKLPGDNQYGDSQPIATRSGWLATGIMPFLIMAAAKLNIITQLTGVSHERLQVFHRWMAYAMLVLALIHTFPFIVMNIRNGEMVMQWNTSVFYWTGVVALLSQAYLTLFSFKAFRDRFYEFFKATHLLAAVVFVVFFFLHCSFTLTSWLFFIATGVAYFAPFLAAWLRTTYEFGFGLKAYITQEANNTVTVRVPIQSWWQPGQHMFLRFVSPKMGVHSLTAHPFTLSSLPESCEAVFHIKVKSGVTRRLMTVAEKYPNSPISVWLDGPYGGMQEEKLANYDRQLIIAGGSGASFTLPLVEKALKQQWRPRMEPNADAGEKSALMESHSDKKLHVVLATRHQETERWFMRELSHMLTRYGPGLDSNPVAVHVHLTQGTSSQSSPAHSTSDVDDVEVQVVRADKLELEAERAQSGIELQRCLSTHVGRPDLRAMIRDMTSSGRETVGIAVCGPSSMMYDVRNAAAEAQLRAMRDSEGAKAVYLHTESFGW